MINLRVTPRYMLLCLHHKRSTFVAFAERNPYFNARSTSLKRFNRCRFLIRYVDGMLSRSLNEDQVRTLHSLLSSVNHSGQERSKIEKKVKSTTDFTFDSTMENYTREISFQNRRKVLASAPNTPAHKCSSQHFDQSSTLPGQSNAYSPDNASSPSMSYTHPELAFSQCFASSVGDDSILSQSFPSTFASSSRPLSPSVTLASLSVVSETTSTSDKAHRPTPSPPVSLPSPNYRTNHSVYCVTNVRPYAFISITPSMGQKHTGDQPQGSTSTPSTHVPPPPSAYVPSPSSTSGSSANTNLAFTTTTTTSPAPRGPANGPERASVPSPASADASLRAADSTRVGVSRPFAAPTRTHTYTHTYTLAQAQMMSRSPLNAQTQAATNTSMAATQISDADAPSYVNPWSSISASTSTPSATSTSSTSTSISTSTLSTLSRAIDVLAAAVASRPCATLSPTSVRKPIPPLPPLPSLPPEVIATPSASDPSIPIVLINTHALYPPLPPLPAPRLPRIQAISSQSVQPYTCMPSSSPQPSLSPLSSQPHAGTGTDPSSHLSPGVDTTTATAVDTSPTDTPSYSYSLPHAPSHSQDLSYASSLPFSVPPLSSTASPPSTPSVSSIGMGTDTSSHPSHTCVCGACLQCVRARATVLERLVCVLEAREAARTRLGSQTDTGI